MTRAEQRKVLIVQAHNLGDAVISTALVETIAHGLPTARIDVLTRPEILQIFARNPHVDQVFTGRFPMGSVHDFGVKELLALLPLLARLRARGYTDVVNLAGDFREELLGAVLSRGANWSPAWPASHPCGQVVRRSRVRIASRPVTIPADRPSIYQAAAIVGAAVSGAVAQPSALYTAEKTKLAWDPVDRVVGIHPMASQPWRRWPMEKWQMLAQRLVSRGIDLQIFGAPSDAEELHRYFGGLDASRVQIITGDLSGYFAAVSRVRILLCLDSFASHVASAIGVPIILLNGANDAAAWAPPGAVVLAHGPAMSCYPCYNRPTCFDTAHEFGCIRDITMESVLEAVEDAVGTSPAGRQLFPQAERPVALH